MVIPTGSERRKHARASLSLDVEWGRTPACDHHRVTSLSVGGCFVSTPGRVAERGVVFVRLMLAPGAASTLEGVAMARVRHASEGVGFGAEFMTLKSGSEKDVHDVVEFYREGGS